MPEISNRINRCDVCKAIGLDGELVSVENYDIKELRKKGYSFTDGTLSQDCYRRSRREEIELGLVKEISKRAPHESCPKIENLEEYTQAILKTFFIENRVEDFMLGFDETEGNTVNVIVKVEDNRSDKVRYTASVAVKTLRHYGINLNLTYVENGK